MRPRHYSRWCSAPNCLSARNATEEESLSFFRFPRDPERSRQWVINTGRKDLLKKDVAALFASNRICSRHFEKNMFMNFLQNRLKHNAVPTLFDDSSSAPKTAEDKDQASVVDFDEAIPRCTLLSSTANRVSHPLTLITIETTPEIKITAATREASPPRAVRITTGSIATQTDPRLLPPSPKKVELRKKIKVLQRNIARLTKRANTFNQPIGVNEFKNLCDQFLLPKMAQFVKLQCTLVDRKSKG